MQKNAFYGYKENQAHYGYRSAILYKKEGETKYQFLCASETVPFPFGAKETSDFSLMNSPTVGQVEGKDTLEQKEIELLYTRNNAILFEKLKGKVLDFMSLTPQLIGYKYSGTIAFRPNDATNDIHRGTYTITPMDADPTPHFTARDEALTPIYFTTSIHDELSIESDGTYKSGGTGAKEVKVNISTNYVAPSGKSIVYEVTKMGVNGTETTQSAITVSNGIVKFDTVGLYIIYAKPDASDTAWSGCFTSIYITE